LLAGSFFVNIRNKSEERQMGYTVFNREQDLVAFCSRIEDAVAYVSTDIVDYDVMSDEDIGLTAFRFLPKFPDGKPCSINILFGDMYRLSVINDGMGSDRGLYEIAVLNQDDNFVNLPGITEYDDDVRGYLTAAQVGTIIVKLYSITKEYPVQKLPV
jgi:hypothetical protein